MSKSRLSLGKKGEKIARRYLKKMGYRILAQNYRTRLGEIDLVAEEAGVVVFIEVKTRSGTEYGQTLEAITRKKRQQISKVALEYLNKNNQHDSSARFDVVSVLLTSESSPQIEIVQDAFDLSYGT